MREAKLDPGWLQSELRRLPVDIMAMWPRERWERTGALDIPFPVGWNEGEMLLNRLSDHFKSWTGRSIEDHIAARPARD